MRRKLQEILSLEDSEIEIINNVDDTYEFKFNNKSYLIIVIKVNKKNQLTDLVGDKNTIIHQIIFNNDQFILSLQKAVTLNLIFGCFLFDDDNDIFIHFKNDQVNNYSLETNEIIQELSINDLETKGITLFTDEEHQANIIFKSKYLGLFLRANHRSNLSFIENQSLYCFDKLYNFDIYTNFEKQISTIEDLDFFPTRSHIGTSKWDRDEFILCLDLYFKIKAQKIRDAKDEPELLKVYDILKQRSINQNKVIRTVDAIYMRIQNYKHVDPNWQGEGLSGGGDKCQDIFNEFVDDRPNLEKEISLILDTYGDGTYSSKIFIRKYRPQDDNHVSDLHVESLDLEEINNLKDRASNLHKKTLNLLSANLVSKKFDVYECPKTFDLLAIKENQTLLFEVKSLNSENFVSQTRSAFAQLLFYEFLHKQLNTIGFSGELQKIIVYHDNPLKYSDNKTLNIYNNFLFSYMIKICWQEMGDFIYA